MIDLRSNTFTDLYFKSNPVLEVLTAFVVLQFQDHLSSTSSRFCELVQQAILQSARQARQTFLCRYDEV